jgi:hypothetical protein
MSDFSLKKWYLDAADNQGNAFIGYWISLRWRALSLSGYQYLWHPHGQGVIVHAEFKRRPEPVWLDPHHLVWQSKNLKSSWQSTEDSIGTTIPLGKGEVNWQCFQPKAKANIELPQFSFSGWGYTECININVPVWNLPFKTLYWGRSHSQNHYLVWIILEGLTRLNMVWLDGKPDNNLVICETRISGSNFNLELGENTPLRKGQLISTVFKPFENIIKLFPPRTFLMDERKWYNQGLLKTGNVCENAITIYEKVTW